MADFLASLNLGAQTAVSSNKMPCNSTEDLQLHLRRVLEAKATPNRAEHISISMELGATARFHLPLSEQENNALEGLTNIDPSLDRTSQSDEQSARQVSRNVDANEALMNQPQREPVLQALITKHIIVALGAIDGSDWITHGSSREAQGWAFTYLCRNSDQVWRRQHAKHLCKSIVGEYSQREPDPILNARPAFDCRGSVIVTFNRNSRLLSVKYDHTLIHKTVAELSEHFKPPPRQPSPGTQRELQQAPSQQKTPKTKADKRAQDAMGPARKKKKKNIGASQPITTEVIMTTPEGVEASHDASVMHIDPALKTPARTSQHNQPLQAQEPQQNAGQDTPENHGFDDDPQGLAREGRLRSTLQTRAAREHTPRAALLAKLPQTEANRRRVAAMAMLTGASVPPDSLSAEQFSLFSNQSPDLQRVSLKMLVKYGAERLRIVHHVQKGSTSSQANAPPTPSQLSQVTSSQSTTNKELVPQSGGPSNEGPNTELVPQSGGPSDKGLSNEGPSNESSDTELVPQPGGLSNEGPKEPTAVEGQAPTTDGKTMAKSRNACVQCKTRRTKCPRERPICSACEARGATCEYAPQKPRKRPPKKGEVIAFESYGQGETQGNKVDAEAYEPNHNGSTQLDESPYPSYHQMPVSGILSSTENIHGLPNYFSDSQNLLFRAQYNVPAVPQHHVSANARQAYETTELEPTPHDEHQLVHAVTEAASTQTGWPNGFRARFRQNQLSESAHEPKNDAVTNDQSSSNANVIATHNGQASQHSNHYVPLASLQVRDEIQQASALAQAATQQQHRQSPTPAAAMLGHASSSSFQAANASGAKSQLGQRRQPKMPASDQSMSGDYQPPLGPNQHARTNSSPQHSSAQIGEMLRQGDGGSYRVVATMHRQESQKSGYDIFPQTLNNDDISVIGFGSTARISG